MVIYLFKKFKSISSHTLNRCLCDKGQRTRHKVQQEFLESEVKKYDYLEKKLLGSEHCGNGFRVCSPNGVFWCDGLGYVQCSSEGVRINPRRCNFRLYLERFVLMDFMAYGVIYASNGLWRLYMFNCEFIIYQKCYLSFAYIINY